MTHEEYIEKILEERRMQANVSEQYEHGYVMAEDKGILGSQIDVEQLPETDRVIIGQSLEEDRPFDRAVFSVPKNRVVEKHRDIVADKSTDVLLLNGTYISLNDFLDVLEKELFNDAPDVIYVAWKTGEQYSKSDLLHDIAKKVVQNLPYLKVRRGNIEKHAYESLSEVRPKTEESKKTKIDLGKFYSRNQQIHVGNGVYILVSEIEDALTDYLRMEKVKDYGGKPIPFAGDDNPQKENEEPSKGDVPTREPVPPVVPTPPSGPIEPTAPTGPTGTTGPGDVTPPVGETLPTGDPIPPVEPQDKKENQKDKIFDVVLRRGKVPSELLKKLLPVIMSLIIFLEGLGYDTEKITQKVEEYVDTMDYSVSSMEEVSVEKQYEDAFDRLGLEIGKKVDVQKGVPFHESSDYDRGGANKKGVFGQGLRKEGKYTVESFSLVQKDGTIIASWKDGTNLGDYVEEVCNKENLSVEDLSIRVHLTDPVSGWVDFEDLGNIKNNANNLKNPQVRLDEKEKINGIAEDFNGRTVTINNGNGNVIIQVTDANGNLLAPGTMVKGSDGQTYRINNLEEKTLVNTYDKVVGQKRTLNWSFNNISAEEWLLNAGLAAMGIALGFTIKKNEEEMAELTEEELNGLVTSAQNRFRAESDFEKAVEKITHRQINQDVVTALSPAAQTLKDSLIEHDVTIEQIGEIKGNRR